MIESYRLYKKGGREGEGEERRGEERQRETKREREP
jgi:hypothetical protein